MNKIAKYLKKYPKLSVKKWMLELTNKYIKENTNGCGDKFTDYFVPDKPVGLDLLPACKIHDLEYDYIIKALVDGSINEIVAEIFCNKVNNEFYQNMRILRDYTFDKNLKWYWSILFWKSKKGRAEARRKTHSFIIKEYYKAVKRCGFSSLLKSYKNIS